MKEWILKKAKEIAEKNFCCSHSNYTVGAVLLTKDGKMYQGFNVENDGILSICAERVAFVKALTEGEHDFESITVVGKEVGSNHFVKTTPCGYCRQFMKEYTNKEFKIYTYAEENNSIEEFTIEELLPESFSNGGNHE